MYIGVGIFGGVLILGGIIVVLFIVGVLLVVIVVGVVCGVFVGIVIGLYDEIKYSIVKGKRLNFIKIIKEYERICLKLN